MPVEISTDVTVPHRRGGVWQRRDTRQVLDLIATRLRTQIDRRKGADGRSFGLYKSGPKAGQPITLNRTGRFQARIAASRVTNTTGEVGSSVPHAVYVTRRYPSAMALAPRDVDEVMRTVGERSASNLETDAT